MTTPRNLDATGAILAALASKVHGNDIPYAPKAEQLLPFTIRVASSEEQLGKAVAIRHAAYLRHLPTLAEALRAPEGIDRDESTVVLLAESKLDGSPLGTLRIQTNRCRKLALEQ